MCQKLSWVFSHQVDLSKWKTLYWSIFFMQLHFHEILTLKQSHYREVARWGVYIGARHNWKCFLAYKILDFFFFNFLRKKEKKINFILCYFSVRTLQYFKKIKKIIAPQNIKNCPQKLLKIPLDQEFSVQQVFAVWNWDSFKGWNCLIFEAVKLCRMKK